MPGGFQSRKHGNVLEGRPSDPKKTEGELAQIRPTWPITEESWAKEILALQVQNQELLEINESLSCELRHRENFEAHLKKEIQALAQSNKDLDQFASIAAHDLREPLHSIQVFLDLIEQRYGKTLGDQGRGYMDRVQNAAARMGQLIQGLLIYARIETSNTPAEPLSLGRMVNEILLDLGEITQRVQAEIHVEALPDYCGDRTHIRQLLQNLIVNALKFHKPSTPPRITISGRIIKDRRHTGNITPSSLWQITVSDQGIGIPTEHLDKIFGMFKRAHRKNDYEGAGIGLSVCKRIVEQSGGTISVESVVGEGSTFTVTLPILDFESTGIR